MNNVGINSYCQLYRNGIIEFLSSSNKVFDEIDNPFKNTNIFDHDNNKLKIIYGGKTGYEYYLIRKSFELLKVLKYFRIQPPVYIFISILNAKGYRIYYTEQNGEVKITASIDRDILNLPPIELKNFNIDIKNEIKNIFNMIWNSCGEKQSINFSKDGKWLGKSLN